MFVHLARHLAFFSLLAALLVSGCAGPGTVSSKKIAPSASGAVTPTPLSRESQAMFTLSGGVDASYTLHATLTASKLRHGHREFTIDVVDGGNSLFIVFYGYQGPGSYTLTNAVNGGDIHIGLQHDAISWDLFMQPTASCQLIVASETPTGSAGLDRLMGSFACASLLSSSPQHAERPVAVTHGSFDIAIVVES